MPERIPELYSSGAADAADRLRLIVTDLRLIDLAVQRVPSRTAMTARQSRCTSAV